MDGMGTAPLGLRLGSGRLACSRDDLSREETGKTTALETQVGRLPQAGGSHDYSK